jgi:hypothetical protein
VLKACAARAEAGACPIDTALSKLQFILKLKSRLSRCCSIDIAMVWLRMKINHYSLFGFIIGQVQFFKVRLAGEHS